MKDKSLTKDLRQAFLATLPVLAGYGSLGIGFGILLGTKGYGPLWSFFIGLTVYAGAMQYVLVDLLAGGVGLITTALTTLMVNARHLFYGISLIDKYEEKGLKKLYLIHGLTDETYSLVCSDSYAESCGDPKRYYLLLTLLDHIYWTAGCTVGGLLGSVITFDTEGIDFALTALFVTILVEQWQGNPDKRPALIGIGSSVICLLLFGKDAFLIPSMALIVMGLTALRIWKGGRQDV